MLVWKIFCFISSSHTKQVKLVNIRNDDITDGNPKLTLGLIWTIILHFQVSLIFLTVISFSLIARFQVVHMKGELHINIQRRKINFRLSFFLFKLNFKFCIGVWLIYNVMFVSGVQQSDSVIHIHISILFQILFSYRLLQNFE